MDPIALARKGPGLCPVIRIPLLGAACLAAALGWTVDDSARAAGAEPGTPATTSAAPRGGQDHDAGGVCAAADEAAAAAPPQGGQDDAPAGAGAYSAEQAERGRAVYREHCTSCHGSSLRGGANEFAAPALAGPFFFDAWTGRPVAELLAYSADNMPPEGPLLPGPDYVDVTAYILQVLGYPEGDVELTADSPALAGVIERQR